MANLYAKSTYRHELAVEDRDTGDALSLSDASITYVMTSKKAGGDMIFDLSEADDEVTVEPDGGTGEVVVELPASDVPSGRLWEELRISFPDNRSAVVYQAQQAFRRVATDPPE